MTTTSTDTDQTIRLSAGALEYTFPLTITEKTGKDISGDTITLSLGTFNAPGDTWLTPDVDQPQDVKSQRVVQLYIGTTVKPDPGVYFLWSKVTDTPEVSPRRNQKITIT